MACMRTERVESGPALTYAYIIDNLRNPLIPEGLNERSGLRA